MEAGPSGAAPLPPPWLATRSLPIATISSRTRIFRIHQLGHGAIFFGPPVEPATGDRQPPTYRFDSASGSFGALYAARQFEGTLSRQYSATRSSPSSRGITSREDALPSSPSAAT